MDNKNKYFTETQLVLSVFSGIDLLGKGFEKNGFCVVGGIDIIFDRDIRDFHPVSNKFDGIIGGSPCQDFSKARRSKPTNYGLEMMEEFKRVVLESNCKWFLLENVPTVPDIKINGYYVQRFCLSPNDLGFSQSRKRHFQFGTKDNLSLIFERTKYKGSIEKCITVTEGNRTERRDFEDVCKLQGLDYVPTLSEFNRKGKYKLLGNAVHYGVACEIAKRIRDLYLFKSKRPITQNICPCGCGEVLTGKKTVHNASCRKRMQYKRERAALIES